MKIKTNILKKFINSIYNVDEFPKYIREGAGKAVLYALLLSIFIGGIKGIAGTLTVNNDLNEAVSIISDDKNQFSINNNELTLENSPIKIEDKGILFYADDSLKVSDADKLKSMTINEDMNFLILKDGLYIKKNVNDIKSEQDDMKVYYTDLNFDSQVNNEDIINIITSTKPEFFGGNIIFYMAREFLMYIMASFIIAVLTIVPSLLWGMKFRVTSLFSLAIYAYTLPSLLVLILSILIPKVEFDTAGMIGGIAYTYLAIRSIKKSFNEKVV